MIVTFDNKAKEIIKNIVTEGDTPEPTPTPGATEFYQFEPGKYTVNPTALLDLFKAKNIDLDKEVSSSGFDILFSINVDNNYADVYDTRINFYLDSSYLNGNLNINNNGDHFDTHLHISSGSFTFKTALEAFEILTASDVPTVNVYAGYSYCPTLWIAVAGDNTTRYALTKEEFEKVINKLPEVLPLAN